MHSTPKIGKSRAAPLAGCFAALNLAKPVTCCPLLAAAYIAILGRGRSTGGGNGHPPVHICTGKFLGNPTYKIISYIYDITHIYVYFLK